VTAAASALAVTTGRGAGGVLLVGGAVLAGQLSIGWLNDHRDADRDVRVQRADKPVAAGVLARRTVGRAAGIAAVACVPLSLGSGLRAGTVHFVAVASGWAYDLGVKSSIASPLPYLVSFGLLPVFVVLGAPGTRPPPWWLPTAGAALGAGAHFANVLPDLDADIATGVAGLPHRLGARASRVAAAALLLTASAVLAVGLPIAPGLAALTPAGAGAVLGAGFLAARRPGSRALFRAVLLVALLDVALLVASGPEIAA
jgi:4-hydroxybenzoate polyprenyltransferase